jgi:hypothetical protein
MSNKLFSMLELSSNGFPHNHFYAIDLEGIEAGEVESYLRDGLRNFRAGSDCRSMLIRTGFAERPEVKLFIATDLDASDDELILKTMKKALVYFSKKFGGYNNGFIILQEWTPEEDYLYSINLMPTNGSFIVEAIKGNHYNLDRGEERATIFKLSNSGINIIRTGMESNDILMLNRLVKGLLNNHFFEDKSVYELSFIKDRASFYQVKRPDRLYKKPISKQEFYEKLKKNDIPFQDRILRK